MKGIILAGGTGSRLFPATETVNKHLLPIHDKPMIYYSLSLLLLAEIRNILLITTERDLPAFKQLFGSGKHLGLQIEYCVQPNPDGLAQSFLLGEDFLAGESCCLVLGDNIFYGHGLSAALKNARSEIEKNGGAYVFGYWVNNPSSYGVAGFDSSANVTSIEEKPAEPASHYAVTGLYFYDNTVTQRAKNVRPSARGELEISCINQQYVLEQKLKIECLGRGFAWLDTGTHQSLTSASQFISSIETRQGIKVACLEEIAYMKGWINGELLLASANKYNKTEYGAYLKSVFEYVNKDPIHPASRVIPEYSYE